MNLILQAIKSLFRKLEISISASVATLTKKINKAQNTADTAKKGAASAQSKANTAQETADIAMDNAAEARQTANTAQIAANHVYKANVSNAVATIIGLSTLEDGNIYTIIPTANSVNTGNAYISHYKNQYPVYSGVVTRNLIGFSTAAPMASSLFRANIPIVILYSATNKAFYCLNRETTVKGVEVNATLKENDTPLSIYGGNGVEVYRYNYMRVKSSTSGSKKLFDIQVDDSGTITAVEVV